MVNRSRTAGTGGAHPFHSQKGNGPADPTALRCNQLNCAAAMPSVHNTAQPSAMGRARNHGIMPLVATTARIGRPALNAKPYLPIHTGPMLSIVGIRSANGRSSATAIAAPRLMIMRRRANISTVPSSNDPAMLQATTATVTGPVSFHPNIATCWRCQSSTIPTSVTISF